MRITIDTDDRTFSHPSLVTSGQPQSTSGESSPIDGGSGPDGDASSASGSTNETDGGGPPQRLLDEIGAAESRGRDATSGDDNDRVTDAGAAPVSL